MGIIKRAADLVYTFRFIKLLNTKWENLEAYKLGLIDKNGKKLKKARTPEEKSAYTMFHRLVYNIKRLIGQNKLVSIPASFWLLKDHYGLSDNQINKIITECKIPVDNIINESSEWFLVDGDKLAKGYYTLKNDKLISESLDDLIKSNDRVRIKEHTSPVGNIMGHNIYVVEHVRTGKEIYVSISEIVR
jgi:hypothetical protein